MEALGRRWSRIDAGRTARTWRRIRREALSPPPPGAFGAFGRSFILPPARISNPQWIHIGDEVTIHEDVWLAVEQGDPDVTPQLRIGDRCRIGRGTQISCAGRIDIEDRVVISDHVHIGDTSHEYADPAAPVAAQGTRPPRAVHIGSGALIGWGVVVLAGVSVGAGAVVRESSVVTRDVAPGGLVAGNPAEPAEAPWG